MSAAAAARELIVYPVYLDGTRSGAQGRRVPKEHACPGLPHAEAIAAAAQGVTGVQTATVQMDKAYPRDTWVKGRVKLTVVMHEGDNKRKLLVRLCKEIISMKSKWDQAVAVAQVQEAAAAASGSKDKDKKKNKKKK
jgi:signal recognition particle subunit SEC65